MQDIFTILYMMEMMESQPSDLLGLPTALRDVDWGPLVRPRRAVFIGATDRDGSQQRAQFLFFRQRVEPLGCEVIPVHPVKAEILGVPASRSVLDVDGDIDVAVVHVRDAVPAVEECVRKGVAFVIVFSAGFAELETAEGRAAQARLSELGRGRTRIIGPNTNLNFFESWRRDLPGKRMAIVTQSGFQGRPIAQGEVYGIGIQSWATVGNEADLEWADFVRYYAGLPGTGAIATYVEGFKSGRTMMLAAGVAAEHGVPIVAIKVGRSAAGAAMASAHTGHLTGADAVHEAAFAQAGIIRVDDHDEAIEISGMFCHVPPLAGPDGVAIYALSGGTAAHLVDLCEANGVPVPRFEERTIKALGEHIPAILRMDNPVDTGGTLTATPAGRATLDAVVEDESTGVLMVPVTGVFPGMIEPLARDLAEIHQQGRKPVLVIWASPVRDNDGYRLLCANGVPVFHSLTAGVRGAKALMGHRRFLAGYRSPFAALPTAGTERRSAVRATLAAGRLLDEVEAKQLLSSYGIPVVSERVAASPQEAQQAIRAAGGTGVLKVLSPDIAHKSDLGLVRVGVTEADAGRVYEDLLATARQAAPEAELRGVVVQPLVSDAVTEAIVGMSHQVPFGPVVLFGLGGIFTEVLRDVAFGVPPFNRARAQAMVTTIKGAPLLAGARGRPAADVDALVDLIMNVQRLALEAGNDITELDINPVMVRPRGHGVVAVDALIVPGTRAGARR
ncbi:MAG: CoA-binding domain protein [Actinomycetia bacterium]|nr:CoA-binding domain protein [Actinomycetes bacterium]